MENIGGVITRDRLEIALLDKEELESNALEVHIHHLRKKYFQNLYELFAVLDILSK